MPRYSDKTFTTYSSDLVRELVNDVGVVPFGSDISEAKTYRAIWDTGATGSTITEQVVREGGLKPSGIVELAGVHGKQTVHTYRVSLVLPNKVNCEIRVAEVILTKGHDILIGMDIIGLGDFAVSSWQGRTTFTFRIPSMGEIDFLQPKHRPKNFLRALNTQNVGRNAPCPCGSGKKYKRCCGRDPAAA